MVFYREKEGQHIEKQSLHLQRSKRKRREKEGSLDLELVPFSLWLLLIILLNLRHKEAARPFMELPVIKGL